MFSDNKCLLRMVEKVVFGNEAMRIKHVFFSLSSSQISD